ncbi:RebB family R body protein [Pseudovibrio denitrificans]|uniref:RebB family R body protein n=1 Tax=Pseudovibrio denitrificans TaxID=258256 RepID=UPI000ADA5E8A|nr:RebB family R body protein [Pseudovibrio denitrificans]
MPKTIEEQCGSTKPSDGGAVDADIIALLGVAPAFALGLTFLTAAQSTGVLFENSVANAQRQNIIAQTALSREFCILILLVPWLLQTAFRIWIRKRSSR